LGFVETAQAGKCSAEFAGDSEGVGEQHGMTESNGSRLDLLLSEIQHRVRNGTSYQGNGKFDVRHRLLRFDNRRKGIAKGVLHVSKSPHFGRKTIGKRLETICELTIGNLQNLSVESPSRSARSDERNKPSQAIGGAQRSETNRSCGQHCAAESFGLLHHSKDFGEPRGHAIVDRDIGGYRGRLKLVLTNLEVGGSNLASCACAERRIDT